MHKLIFYLFFLIPTSSLFSCDACGCGIGNSGFGLLGIYRSNFIGLQYGYAGFKGLYSSGEATGTKDFFHTTNLLVRYSPLSRLRLQLSQSYHSNRRTGNTGQQQLDGFGDLNIQSSYAWLNDIQIGKNGYFYLETGLGISLPTGRYEDDPLRNYFLPDNFSPGRGASAFSSSVILSYTRGKAGVNLSIEGKWHAKTPDGYRFGSEQRVALQAFGQFSLGRLNSWVPFVGLQYEYTNPNKARSGNDVHATGGSALLVRTGVQFKFPRFTYGIATNQPLSTDYASGEVVGRIRVSAEAYYHF